MREVSLPRAAGTAPPSGLSHAAALSGIALAVVVLLAALALARHEVDADFRAETTLLGLVAAFVVASVGAVAKPPALELQGAALVSVLALWVLPAGTPRSAVILALLVASCLAAAVRRLDASETGAGLREAAPRLPSFSEAAAIAIPLSFAAQCLLRGDRLIEPLTDPTTLVRAVGLPALGGAAFAVLAARRGLVPAAMVVGSLLLLRPGFDVMVTLTLVAVAAGVETEARADRVDRPRRLLVLALLLAPIAWEPRAGVAAAVAGLAAGGGWLPALAAGAGGILALVAPLRPWPEALAALAWLPLVLPALVLPARGRLLGAGAGLALAVGAARGVPGDAALAAPLALLVLCLARGGAVAAAQRAWTAALFAGTAILASYPWLRQAPLADALALAGITPDAEPMAVLLAGVLAIAGAERWLPRRLLPRPAVIVGVGTALALLAALPTPGRILVRRGPVVLEAHRPEQGVDLDRPLASEVVIESRLVHAAGLPAGSPASTLSLRDDAGETHGFVLKSGIDTGEWAARRPDVRLLSAGVVPSPFRTQLEPGGEFFAQTYRTRWRLGRQVRAARLEVARSPALPPEVVVQLLRVELRP
jgi:hypothetical protein